MTKNKTHDAAQHEVDVMLKSLGEQSKSFFAVGRFRAKKKLSNGYTVTFDIRQERPRPLTKNQQEIVDACAAGARIVHRTWTSASSRGRGVSMRRRERWELKQAGKKTLQLRGDSVERLAKRGLVKIEEHDQDDHLKDFVTAVRNGDTPAADAAVQRAVAKGLRRPG